MTPNNIIKQKVYMNKKVKYCKKPTHLISI